jgi:hypothetical protein
MPLLHSLLFEEILPGATLHAKSKLKKTAETKTNIINFNNLSQVDVIKWVFAINGAADKYEVSSICGPYFKLWYTGVG